MTDKQAEALRLAEIIGGHAGDELRRLHARVSILETQLIGMDSRRAEEKLRADQMTKQHDTQAALNREARNKLAQLTSQLEAIGAGGVESLRKRITEKIIDELMVLVFKYAYASEISFDASPEEQATRAKLREVLERNPLSNTEISLAAHNSDPGDWNNLVHETCWLDGFHEGVKHAESHHGIGS